jgi:hypothetical protein
MPMPTYENMRSKIRSGDLLVWSHLGWKSWYDFKIQTVRFLMRSEYCHVGVAWAVGGRIFVLEAVIPRVRIFPLSKLTPFYWLPMNLEWKPKTEEFALGRIGEPYSEIQAVKAFLNMLKPGEDAEWQCAEYVNAVLKKEGIDMGDITTPSEIVLAVQERYDIPMYYVTKEKKRRRNRKAP